MKTWHVVLMQHAELRDVSSIRIIAESPEAAQHRAVELLKLGPCDIAHTYAV